MNAKPKARMFPYWIFVETAGIALLLSLIVYLPVKVSERIARKAANLDRDGYYESSDSRRREFLHVIQAQLSALQRGDYQQARSLASRKFRKAVPLLEFERLIQKGYPMMLEPVTAELLGALDNGEIAFTFVLLRNSSGDIFPFEYILRAKEGVWRIFAVKHRSISDVSEPELQSQGQRANDE